MRKEAPEMTANDVVKLAEGNNIYGVEYPFASLTGTGSVKEYPVKCISPQWMVKFHRVRPGF